MTLPILPWAGASPKTLQRFWCWLHIFSQRKNSFLSYLFIIHYSFLLTLFLHKMALFWQRSSITTYSHFNADLMKQNDRSKLLNLGFWLLVMCAGVWRNWLFRWKCPCCCILFGLLQFFFLKYYTICIMIMHIMTQLAQRSQVEFAFLLTRKKTNSPLLTLSKYLLRWSFLTASDNNWYSFSKHVRTFSFFRL